ILRRAESLGFAIPGKSRSARCASPLARTPPEILFCAHVCAYDMSLLPTSHESASGATALPQYAELHCLSNFTFLRGASHPHELVEQADLLGYAALAITDECSVAGVVRATEHSSVIARAA